MRIQHRPRVFILIVALALLVVPNVFAQTVAPPPGAPIAPPDIPIQTDPAPPSLFPPPGVTPPGTGCTLFDVPPAAPGEDITDSFYFVDCIVPEGSLIPGNTPSEDGAGLDDNVITFYVPVPPSDRGFTETMRVEQQSLADIEYEECDFSDVVEPGQDTLPFDVDSFDEAGDDLPTPGIEDDEEDVLTGDQASPLIVATLNPTILLACDPETGDLFFIDEAIAEEVFDAEAEDEDLPSSTFIIRDFDLLYLLVEDISADA